MPKVSILITFFVSVFCMLAALGAFGLLFAPGTVDEQAVTEPDANQQYMMPALISYDITSRGSGAHFRKGSVYESKQETEERQHYNQSILMAKSTGVTLVLDDLAYFERLPSSIRDDIKKEFASSDWDAFCENIDGFDVQSLQHAPTDLEKNREAWVLLSARSSALSPQYLANTLGTTLVDMDTAIERANGDREPLTCEDVWSIREDSTLSTDIRLKVAKGNCEGIYKVTQCFVHFEEKLRPLIEGAVKAGQSIEPSWKTFFLDENGKFVIVMTQ